MRLKNEYLRHREDIVKYDLTNSIIPALQTHMIICLRIPQDHRETLYKTCLSPNSINSIYIESCIHISDWT